jgi:Na+:H+ antiporter, NhaC family
MQKPSLLQATIPIIFLIALLGINVVIFESDATGGPNQMALLFAAAAASIVAIRLGRKWTEIADAMVNSISSSMQAVIILLLIGALSGTWLLSGIVPAMIYYGLLILNAKVFLFAACIVCAIVSLATGSSWSTVATIGIALLGIGKALGFSEGIIAGAIISGAYFGDKMSPLSDTTNLAPAMAGTDLFTHIRHMIWTTVPSISITIIIFLLIGIFYSPESTSTGVNEMLVSLKKSFYISPVLFIVPVIVIALIIKKMPAVPALLIGAVLGAVFAVIFQPQAVVSVSGDGYSYLSSSYIAAMKSMASEISITTENETVNELLKGKGMYGMLNTIWLIMCAMMFGGAMETGGLLQRITESVIKYAKSTGSLIASTAGTCVFFNFTASDQYLAIVVPGRMYADTYKKRGLSPENLSRTLEDSGTVTSVLVPWNTCGATQSSVLGVATGTYLPYCFFNIISPFMTILFGFLNIKITKQVKKETPTTHPEL